MTIKKRNRGACNKVHEQILELSLSKTTTEIANILNIPKTTLHSYCKKHGITPVKDRICVEDYKDKILELAAKGVNSRQIAIQLGIEVSSLNYFIKTRKIKVVNGNEYADYIKSCDDVVSLYAENKTYSEIAEELSIPYKWVSKCLDYAGIPKRTSKDTKEARSSTNHEAFKVIDSESAYWLGWIITDGCISDNNVIYIGLKGSDYKIIEQIRDYLKPTTNIRVKEYFHKQSNKIISQVSFAVMSESIATNLRNQNVYPRKSCNERLPNFDWLNADFAPIFWRAVIEGDGCIRLGNKSPEISLVGSEELLCGFKKFSEVICGVKPNKQLRSKKNGNPNFRTIAYTGDDCRKIVRKLWSAGTIFLERKKVIAEQIIQQELTGIIKQ